MERGRIGRNESKIIIVASGDFSRGLMGNYFFGLRRSGQERMMSEK